MKFFSYKKKLLVSVEELFIVVVLLIVVDAPSSAGFRVGEPSFDGEQKLLLILTNLEYMYFNKFCELWLSLGRIA